MHREGTDADNVQPKDILCDFCHRAVWAMGLPCIEGHHGSVVCGDCLKVAWAELVDLDGGGCASRAGVLNVSRVPRCAGLVQPTSFRGTHLSPMCKDGGGDVTQRS